MDGDHLKRQGEQSAFDGLTVRDLFAAHALQGILASHSGEVTLPDDGKAAKWAYEFADKLPARRAAPPAARQLPGEPPGSPDPT